MSIENKLKYHLKTEASKLETPPHLDAAILRNYRKQVMGNRSEKMNVKSLYKKAITIAAIVVVLCGFGYGATQIFSTTEGNVTYSVIVTDEFNQPSEKLTKTYIAMEEVRAKLNEGEAAVLYKPDLNEEYPFVAVYKPIEENEWEKWKQVLQSEQIKANEQLLNEKFKFVAGLDSDPFLSFLYYDAEEQGVYELIEQYDQNDENKLIWKKISINLADTGIENHVTLYKNAEGQSIYVVASTMHPPRAHLEAIKGETMVGEPEYEIKQFISTDKPLVTKKIGEYDVNYIHNNSTYSSTGTIQSVAWLEKSDKETIIYNVVTDADIKEKTLFDIAEQIIAE